MFKDGWKKYLNGRLFLIMFGFLLSYASGIVGLYAPYAASNVIGIISSLLVTIYFVNETIILYRSTKKIQKNLSSENIEMIEKESGQFAISPVLTAINVTSNSLSLLSTTAKLLPILQPNQQGQFDEPQKAILSVITSINALCLMGNLSYTNIFPSRNSELSSHVKTYEISEEAEQGVNPKSNNFN